MSTYDDRLRRICRELVELAYDQSSLESEQAERAGAARLDDDEFNAIVRHRAGAYLGQLAVLLLDEVPWYLGEQGGKRELPERMSHGFAVFNLHVNDARRRADAEVKAQFGEEAFKEIIAPQHRDGIMTILEDDRMPAKAWVILCTAYVNEGRR